MQQGPTHTRIMHGCVPCMCATPRHVACKCARTGLGGLSRACYACGHYVVKLHSPSKGLGIGRWGALACVQAWMLDTRVHWPMLGRAGMCVGCWGTPQAWATLNACTLACLCATQCQALLARVPTSRLWSVGCQLERCASMRKACMRVWWGHTMRMCVHVNQGLGHAMAYALACL